MSELNRYAVFALLDSRSSCHIRSEQIRLASLTDNQMAFCFPIHITLRGRFIAKEDVVTKAFNDIKTACPLLPAEISLSEPRYIKPELGWLEVLPKNRGYEHLVYLHRLFEDRLKGAVIEDEVPESYKNSAFRPHVTLGWGVTPELWERYLSSELLTLKQTSIDQIALVIYPHSLPLREPVSTVLTIS